LPKSWRISPIGRFLSTCYGLPRDNWYGLRSRCALLARNARLRLLAAGIPLQRQYLVVRCRDGNEALGLFSEFATVLGALDHFELWKSQYAGMRVDFAARGLYYDAAFGANWWQYYFDPIEIGSAERAGETEVASLGLDLFVDAAQGLSRERGFELIDRYVRPKSRIRAKVETYVREHFQGTFVVGIHYRGTDKSEEAIGVPYRRVHAAVLDALKTARPARYKLFVATDEQAFLDYMRALYPGDLLFRDMFRSSDGRPIDVVNQDGNHEKGEDAVVDCLLLARCQILIRTESNLSTCSTLFNPGLPQVPLNRPHYSRIQSMQAARHRLPESAGMIVVPHLEIHITHKCNLTCEGCLHFTNHRHSGTLSIDELRGSMSLWNRRLIPRMFAVLGGEPCLHRDLVDILYMTREMWPNPMTKMELISNGLLLHLHPGLPQALLDTGTALHISIHSDASISPRYQEKISRSLKLAREWQGEHGIEVTAYPYTTWARGYTGSGNEMMPFEDRDPEESWKNCITGQQCFQLFENCLWKCAPLAYLRIQDRKFNLSEKWKPYLEYKPLQPGCTDEEIIEFFGRRAESVCAMCPSSPQEFTKRDPLLPLRFHRKEAS
jgi:hypothetical protein